MLAKNKPASRLKNKDSSSKVVQLYNDNFLIGKILKDENTLEEYKIEDGVTVHLVKGKSAAASGSTSTTSTDQSQST